MILDEGGKGNDWQKQQARLAISGLVGTVAGGTAPSINGWNGSGTVRCSAPPLAPALRKKKCSRSICIRAIAEPVRQPVPVVVLKNKTPSHDKVLD